MAWPGDEVTAVAGGHGHLRASHADREQVIDVLKAAFVQGRLDKDEFSLRVGEALASRTCADLAALTTDIPARQTATQSPRVPARECPDKKAVKTLACATAVVTAVFAAPVMVGAMTEGGGIPVFFLAMMFTLFSVPLAAMLLQAWLGQRLGRRSARARPPGGGAWVLTE